MVGIIIQSRMGSARLPGKSLRKIQGEPLLHYCVARAKLSKYADELVVATTIKQEDDSIEEWCLANGVECFRGSEEDVLDRYYQAASKYGFQTVVRLTADNPFIDPRLIDLLVISFLVYDNDYIGMGNNWPYGLGIEVFTFETLKKVWEAATLEPHREHVTLYIKENADSFKTKRIPLDRNLSNIRLTVDYQKDFDRAEKLLCGLLSKFGINFSWYEAVNLYKEMKFDEKI